LHNAGYKNMKPMKTTPNGEDYNDVENYMKQYEETPWYWKLIDKLRKWLKKT